MKKYRTLLAGAIALFVCCCLASCAGAETLDSCLRGERYGFLHGLLHGFITPVSFVASLFNDNVAVYAVNNTGGWYDFGFLLGSSGWGFMAGKGQSKRSKVTH
jgi:hypothetical protein